MDAAPPGKTVLAWQRRAQGVGDLLILLFGVLLLFLLGVWVLPVQVRLRLRQSPRGVLVSAGLQMPLVGWGGEVNVTDLAAEAVQHILDRWRLTGEPIRVPLQKTIRRAPLGPIWRAVGRPVQYLARRTRCALLAVAAEVGGSDAMESALLAGAGWALLGGGIGWISQYVSVQPGALHVDVRPDYSARAWRVRMDCILHMRAGHAIVAGVWLVRRSIREREIVLWIRDSWRRKGEEGVERTSNPGIDEDSHGEPEGHGRRQHRGG